MSRSVLNTVLSTMYPTMRERNTTKVLTTPWISVSVTISPLVTCEISWPSTASTSSLFIDCSSPLETATSAEFLNAPVANALGSPSYNATSGMPMPALSASTCTVSTSQSCSGPSEPSITCARVDHFAIGFDINSEINEPPKPTTSENTSSALTLMPLSVRKRSTPSTLSTTDSTSITARLVSRNNTIRFIGGFSWNQQCANFWNVCASSRTPPRFTPNVQVTSPT